MKKDRRNLTIALTGVPMLISGMGQQDLITEVQRVLRQPSSGPGDKELQDLKQKMIFYWQARHNVIIPPADLIPHVDAYVREVTALLDLSLLPAIRTRLCVCLGEGTHLIGACLDDVGQSQRARAYYRTALEAAQEAADHILQALVWYGDAFSWLYSNGSDRNEQHARDSMLKAAHFASLESDRAVQCRVQAGLAEVYAICKEKAACMEALRCADNLGEYGYGDRYYIHGFDQSRLNGFRGICLQQFYQRDNPDTDPLLEDARQALKEASAQMNVDRRQRACLMVDMAQVYAREGEVESACNSARQIIDMARTDTPLQKRLLMVRTLLEPYKDVQVVKELDMQLKTLLLPM